MERRGNCFRLIVVMLLACMAGGSMPGCARSWYRQQADDEVAGTLAEKNGYLDHGSVLPRSDSRLHDPFDPDGPPLPPDDPASHQLMHHVDGIDGYSGWHANGDAQSVDAQTWIDSLPRDEQQQVRLSLVDAIRVARNNSRDYQQELEDLYLSALDVTFERFRFDHQFFAGNATNATFLGRDRGPRSRSGSSSLNTTTSGEVRRLTATGGELVVGLANTIAWEFSNGDIDAVGSTLDFALVQPLLRFGGRRRVLERLTQSERTLLANVRQMQQYRQGFYVDVAMGRNSGSGPVRRGDVGQSGLGVLAGFPSGRTGASDAGGYLGLLQDQQQIRNQVSNIAALRDSLEQLEAAFEANRIGSSLQVDQARQALLNAQSSLLSSQAGYASRVDSYKLQLGLPPDLPVRIEDPLLDRFNLIDPAMTQLQNELVPLLHEIRRQRDNPQLEQLQQSMKRVRALDDRVDAGVDSAVNDLQALEPQIEERLTQLRLVAVRVREQQADVAEQIYSEEQFLNRIQELESRIESLQCDFVENREALDEVTGQVETLPAKDAWEQLNKAATQLSDLLLELSLVQAEARLQGIVLVPIDLQPAEAVATARNNRLDWMNARANLVDAWRQIEFDANALESDLDLVLEGELATRGDNPVEFRSENSRVRFGLQFDTPITRLAERNQYRETLINYQQARRRYMLFEDQVVQSIRNTLRIVDLSRINFEVRRAAVQVAIAQVDNARLRLNPPVQPGQATRTSPTAARDLLSALNDLLDAQNDFLNVWVNYQVIRALLDFELGTMQLSHDGLWIDPGHIFPVESPGQIEFVPPDELDQPPPAVPELQLPAPDEIPVSAESSEPARQWHPT